MCVSRWPMTCASEVRAFGLESVSFGFAMIDGSYRTIRPLANLVLMSKDSKRKLPNGNLPRATISFPKEADRRVLSGL